MTIFAGILLGLLWCATSGLIGFGVGHKNSDCIGFGVVTCLVLVLITLGFISNL